MSDALLSAGLVVGETWEIERPLGRGGMGEVWLARHLRMAGKQAAIKVLRTTVEGLPDKLTRFRREAEIAARLEHPNIVQVFDFATLPSGAPYLVMEYLRGESLSERLQRGPLSLTELQGIVVQVGSALHTAHAGGVVHRDLKPENIFLVATPTGVQVKVLDFGISKLIDSQTLKTSEDVIMGTPQYMSPEQATAEHQAISGQSDIFSLATVCFEALSGRRPFAAESLARVVYLIAFEPTPSLGTQRPDLPQDIIAAVDRALAKSLADRTPDIATFVHDFAGVTLAGAAVHAAPPPSPRSSQPTVARPSGPRTAPASEPNPRPSAPTVESRPSSPRPTLPTVPERPAARGKPNRAMWPAILAVLLVVGVVGLNAFFSTPEPRAAAPALDAGLRVAEGPDAGPIEARAEVDASVPGAEPASTHDLTAPRETVRRPPRVEPPTAEQALLLDRARAALANEKWGDVLDWTLKPAVAERPEAITLRLTAWCHLGNLSLVNAYKHRLSPLDRPAVARACRARGIDL